MCEEEREELWLEGGGVRFVYTDDYVDSILAKVAELGTALREAKEALSELHRVNLNNYMHDPDDYENTAQASMASKAITTINKVLGEE